MRKTLLLISAVFAMLAAVSCNKEELNNVDVPQTSVESLEFIAYTDVATKTTLNGVKTEWESGDEIAINGVCYFTEDEGTMAKFIKDPSEEGNPGVPFYAVYPYYANMDEGEYVIDFLSSGNTTLTAGSIGDDVISIAYSESEHELNFKNVVSLIKFQVPAEGISEIRISATENLAGELTVDYNGGEEPKVTDVSKGQKELVLTASEGTFAVRTDYYVPVLPGAKTNLTVKIDGTVVAEGKSIEFKRSKIHYLGTLPSVPEPDPVTIYLKPGVWDVDNAWFAAHFFNANDYYSDVKMTDSDSDGIYEALVPANGDKVIFCRMNPNFDEFGWEDGHVWTQTEELEVPTDANVCYSISDWETGLWMTLADAKVEPEIPEVTPGEASPWSITGTFNSWGDKAMVTTNTANVFVAEDVTLEAYASFKVRKDKTWTENYGGGIVYFNPNNWMQVYSNGSDISITAAGTYDIYFDYTTKKLYAVTAGADYTTVPQQTTEGKEPEVEEPEVTGKTLYLKPNSNWTEANARFAAYFFTDKGNAWVGMKDSDEDGIYEVNIPTGYNEGDKVIFCRMNPSSVANNWNNKWNQTGDLIIPTDGKNLFTVPTGAWDGSTTGWSVK